jgi:hypothetical protein
MEDETITSYPMKQKRPQPPMESAEKEPGLVETSLDKKESEPDSGKKPTKDHDTKMLVSEDTRILPPNEFDVVKDESQKHKKQTQVAEQKEVSDIPSQAGPMDQTSVLASQKDPESKQIDTAKASASESLFKKHHEKGLEAFNRNDWKHAIYHLNVAYTLKPNDSSVRDKLREARKKRKEAEQS